MAELVATEAPVNDQNRKTIATIACRNPAVRLFASQIAALASLLNNAAAMLTSDSTNAVSQE
jgi:DNA-binding IclR family transcriptional regulator